MNSPVAGDNPTPPKPDFLSPAEWAVLQTVIYSSLFHFPVTAEELSLAAIGCLLTPEEAVNTYRSSPSLQQVIQFSDNYFFPDGKAAWIRLRRLRTRHSLDCLTCNRRLLQGIAVLPGVRLAALSGSAAHLNIGRQGDIDLFVMTHGSRVWSVALAAVLLAKLARRRRMICLNYLISDRQLQLPSPDLFDANQLIHLKVLRGSAAFRDLLKANPWVNDHYPHALLQPPPSPRWLEAIQPPVWLLRWTRPLNGALCSPLGRPLEWVSRTLYRTYLRRRSGYWQSPSQVKLDRDVLKLHTQSHRDTVTRRFNEELQAALTRLRI